VVLQVGVSGLVIWLLIVQSRLDPRNTEPKQEERHRAMLTDLHDGLTKQADRLAATQADAMGRMQSSLAALQNEQTGALAAQREEMVRQFAALQLDLQQRQDALRHAMLGGTLEKLNEQGALTQQKIESTLRLIAAQITSALEGLTKTTDARLNEIAGKVNERLDEGFKKTNETFANVMARLATIDEAQKKIDGLTTNVVSLQQLLGDKKSRGAFGEMQLEQIVRNMLPEASFEFQYAFSREGTKVVVDCVLKLPEPIGLLAIDAKFPLENFERMVNEGAPAGPFKADVKKHIADIAAKYIIPGQTSDGAMMFVPAEAVFAEIHAHHRDLVEYAQQRRVWIASPTTLMAVLTTSLAVLRDVQTRKQVHLIRDALGKLGADFGRFQSRMDDLAKHIGQANRDVEQIHISSKKMSEQFRSIEKVELDALPQSGTSTGAPELTLSRTNDTQS
jgi:DNA recombination protein RmuC